MQDFNTIIGVIQMRQNECSFSVIQKRYNIGSGTTQRILSRFEASGLTLEELRQMDPHIVEELIYGLCLWNGSVYELLQSHIHKTAGPVN